MVKPTEKANLKHIVRVANVDIPGTKKVRNALTHIKGVGINFADAVCRLAGIERGMKAGALTEEDVKKLDHVLLKPAVAGMPSWMFNRRRDQETGEDVHYIIGTLQFHQENDIKRLKKVKAYRGIRHMRGLPSRGQRTRSNFRRNKGRVVGVKKKK